MKHSNDPFWVLKYYSMIHFVILHFLDKIMTVFKDKSKQYDFNLSFFLKLFISIPLLLFLTSCGSRTPTGLDQETIKSQSKKDYDELKAGTENIVKEIDLYQAIAIGIKHNRNLRIQMMESALSQGQIDVVKFDMLPQFAASAGYKHLSQFPGSTSLAISDRETGPAELGEDPSYTVSSERNQRTGEYGFTWNALDFGLSYVRAGQQADRFLISKELERKAVQNLTREIIYAYWKTISADYLLDQINPLMEKVDSALEDMEYIETLLLSSPMDALLYQKELLDVAQILDTQRRALMDARVELADLMGLLPDEKYVLVHTAQPLTELRMDLKRQEETALFSRPELLEVAYQERVNAGEARARMLSLFPSLRFDANWTYDSNKYLYNKGNFEYGTLLGVNLLNVFQSFNNSEINELNEKIIKEQRLALSMTILSQVHIANINYAQTLREYSNARQYLEVSQRINDLISNAQKISRFGELEIIREEASLLVAKLRNDIAFAEMQYSLGSLYSSVGMNFVPNNALEMNEKDLAKAIESNLNRWTKKYTALVVEPLNEQKPTLKQLKSNDNLVAYSSLSGGGFIFKFSNETFYLEGKGRKRYHAELADGNPLPSWLALLPSTNSFVGIPIESFGSLDIRLTASNDVVSIDDVFTLTWDLTKGDLDL